MFHLIKILYLISEKMKLIYSYRCVQFLWNAPSKSMLVHSQARFPGASGACLSTGGNDPRAPCLSSWTLVGPAMYVLECDPALPHPAVEWLGSLIFCSGTLEHAAHPGAVLSFLWPLSCTFLPSEQAEQRPLCAPVSNTHTHTHTHTHTRVCTHTHIHTELSTSPAASPSHPVLRVLEFFPC